MKKFLLIMLLLSATLIAAPVSQQNARIIADNFLKCENILTYNTSPLELTYKIAYKQNDINLQKINDYTCYYIFNKGDEGFIIISGDDAAYPILAYSNEGKFNPDNIPFVVAKWLEVYKSQLQFIIANKLEASEDIKTAWLNLQNGKFENNNLQGAVAPLCKTKWNQSPYFNSKCPYDNKYQELTVTGCPATAMAQIMKYWNYPSNGVGFHSYNHSKYGNLSANFGSTKYNWANMPNTVNSNNDDVATLMFHLGVAVEMDYNVAQEGGSGSYVVYDKYNRYSETQTCEYAFKTYFGYLPSIKGLYRSDYQDNAWVTLLKKELDESRPIQYAGYGNGGHTWVCDGYDNNNFFHMNWGWGGMFDGYFSINALNPGTGGIGSGAGNFNTGQQALIGIQPPKDAVQYKISLYSNILASQVPLPYNNPFSIYVNLYNEGTSNFAGDFCVAAFDKNNKFIDYVDIKSNWSLGAGMVYQNNIEFKSNGSLAMLPGTYSIGVFYKPTGGNWVAVGNTAQYYNFQTLKVVNYNNISLFSEITTANPNGIYKGSPITFNVDIVNYSTTTFEGVLALSLFDSEGKFVKYIELKENVSLESNYHFTDGLDFKLDVLDVEPGTYYVVLNHLWNNSNWELTGSTDNYINPIKIVIQQAPYKADSYENNNDKNSAYNLNIVYSNNSANKKTSGSNFHVGNDFDYYKIDLQSGYEYTINSRIQDSESSNDGGSYSVDALFAISTDNGNTWSDSYDDVMPSSIKISGGKSLYLVAAPYFLGFTGTYLLDVNLTRVKTNSVDEITDDSKIAIYPNPANSKLNIDLNDFNTQVQEIIITNILGQELIRMKDISKSMNLDLLNFENGFYSIKLILADGNSLFKNFIVSK